MSNVLADLEQLRETQEERRKQYRLKICRPVHIRILDTEKQIQEDTTTLDISGYGFCFATSRNHYQLGMPLFLRFGWCACINSPLAGGLWRCDSVLRHSCGNKTEKPGNR